MNIPNEYIAKTEDVADQVSSFVFSTSCLGPKYKSNDIMYKNFVYKKRSTSPNNKPI